MAGIDDKHRALLNAIENLLKSEIGCKDEYGYREDSDGKALFFDAKHSVEWLMMIIPHLQRLRVATDASCEEHAAEVLRLLNQLRDSYTPEYAWLQVQRILKDTLGGTTKDL
jgi:hypothetical protein